MDIYDKAPRVPGGISETKKTVEFGFQFIRWQNEQLEDDHEVVDHQIINSNWEFIKKTTSRIRNKVNWREKFVEEIMRDWAVPANTSIKVSSLEVNCKFLFRVKTS